MFACWPWCEPAKNTLDSGGISMREVLALTLLLHSRPPCAPQRTPRGHTRPALCCCKAYAGSRAREPMYGRRIVQWARRLPCAACMHAAGVRGSADIRFEKLRRLIVRGPAWHGMAWPCASYSLVRLFPGIGSAGVAEKAKSRTRAIEGLLRQHIILQPADDTPSIRPGEANRAEQQQQ